MKNNMNYEEDNRHLNHYERKDQLMLSELGRVDTLRLRDLSSSDLLSYSFHIHKQEVAVMNSCRLARWSWLDQTTLKLS